MCSTVHTAIASPKKPRIVRTRKLTTRSCIAESIPHRPDGSGAFRGESASLSLRDSGIEQELTLPDGRTAVLRIAVAHDGYIPEREEDTVILELRIGGHVAATLNTVLDPDQEDEANELAREVIEALGSGRVPPTATALEQYADQLR